MSIWRVVVISLGRCFKDGRPGCKCARCLVGPLDRSALLKIPAVGECQKCHKQFEVVANAPCPLCGYAGGVTDVVQITG